jgi:hypothetical protein
MNCKDLSFWEGKMLSLLLPCVLPLVGLNDEMNLRGGEATTISKWTC